MNQTQINADQSSTQKRKQFLILFLIIFTLIICAIILVFTVLKHQIESESLSANPVKAIKAACKVTMYKYYSTCIKSISSLHNFRHKIHASDIFRLSINAALNEFLIVNQLPQELAAEIGNKNIRPVLTDCQNLFHDSLIRLNMSLRVITKNDLGLDDKFMDSHGEELMRNLINSSMGQAKKNVERCIDGLAGKGTTQEEIVEIKNAKDRIQKAEICMVISLAILENKDSI